MGAGPHPGRQPRLQELHRAADRGHRPRPRPARSSCTAPAASARCSPPRRWPRWATPTSPPWPRAVPGLEERRLRVRQARRPGSPSRSSATAATCSSRRSGRPVRPSCWPARPCSSERAAWAARRRCTSPRPASGRSAWSTSTSSTSATSSARSSTPRPAWGSARSRARRSSINALNPEIDVIAHEEMLVADNVERIIAGYDVILDGTDTFETRYILNDAAVAAGIPVDPCQRLPVRGPADDLRPVRGAVLPLPVPDPAAARARAGLLRGRRPGRRARASSACSRPTRRSRSCSASATRWPAGCSCSMLSRPSSPSCSLRRDPNCPVCSDEAVEARKSRPSRWRRPRWAPMPRSC